MVVLHPLEPDDAGLIAALRAEDLPAPGAGRYFSADHDGAVVGYVGLEGDLERYARDHGIRTVINLRGANPSEAWYRDEVATARRLGLRHIDFRMSAKRGITNEEAWRLIQVMRDAPKPLLIHCESGADRSGLASALYVAAVEGLGEEAAERHLSLRYGHVQAPFGKGWGSTVTWERMEPSLGFVGS